MASTPSAERGWLRAVEPLVVAALAGIAGVAGSFAVAGFTPSFVAGPIAGFLARYLPAPIITFAIVVLGDLGEQLNLLTALGLAVVLLGATSLVGWVAGHRFDSDAAGGVVAAVLTGAAAYLVTGATLPSLVAGLAAGVVLTLAAVGEGVRVETVSPERRRVLAGAAGALAFVLGGLALGSRETTRGATVGGPAGIELAEPIREDVQANLADAETKSLDVEDLEPLVSTEFYQVDINPTDPVVDAATWELRVTGAVERELTYTYEDVLAMDASNQFVSLRCVGESLNGRKLDNALWTGVPVMELVEPAGVSPTCCVMLRAADGYFEEFPLPALEDGFLAYAMNGEVLPREHGYPARALIPGHWGEINVKWLTEIEVLTEEIDGYWERRGWHGTGPVNTVAKLHVVNHLDDGRIEVAGHAYAGTRGIDRVEVSADGGATWVDAELSEPLPGTDVWRQWVHRYEPPGSAHEVVVRATDGTGALQPREEAQSFPNGPSGWVARIVRP